MPKIVNEVTVASIIYVRISEARLPNMDPKLNIITPCNKCSVYRGASTCTSTVQIMYDQKPYFCTRACTVGRT